MTTKHTPGPWEVFKTNPRENGAIIPTVWNKHAQVAEVGGGQLEAVANARLIAAAPTLLDELGAVLSAMVVVDLRLDVEKKQSDEQGTDVYILAGAHQQIKERIKAARAAIEKAIG